MTAPPTPSLTRAQPDDHTLLMAGFLGTILTVLPIVDSTNECDLEAAAAALLDALAAIVACLPAAATPAARAGLVGGIARDLDASIIAAHWAPERLQAIRAISKAVVQ